MSHTSSSRRAKLPREIAPVMMSSPTDEEFRAECEALSSAVAANLDVTLRVAEPVADMASADFALDNAVTPTAKPVYYPGEMEFVPAYGCILEHAGVEPGDGADSDEVRISRQLLEFLLRCVLDRVDFDEQQYQKCNPDVAAAIKRRDMHSGREHFIKTGYFEGRSGGVRVDEAWYLSRNPDVAAAKKAGKFLSGSAQYRLSGASEWRAPNPQSEDAVRMWKNVLER